MLAGFFKKSKDAGSQSQESQTVTVDPMELYHNLPPEQQSEIRKQIAAEMAKHITITHGEDIPDRPSMGEIIMYYSGLLRKEKIDFLREIIESSGDRVDIVAQHLSPEGPKKREVKFDPGEMIYDKFDGDWQIVYQDAKGDGGERTITPKQLYEQDDGDLYIHAFCHKRDMIRWFKVERINELTLLNTGEVIEDPYLYISKLC